MCCIIQIDRIPFYSIVSQKKTMKTDVSLELKAGGGKKTNYSLSLLLLLRSPAPN